MSGDAGASVHDARLQIAQVVNEYGFLVDGRAWDELDRVLLADSVFDATAVGGPRCEGLKEIVRFFRRARHPVAHHVTNIVFDEVGASTARVRSKYLAPVVGGRVVSGEYHDELSCENGMWRIRSRRLVWRRPASDSLEPPAGWLGY